MWLKQIICVLPLSNPGQVQVVAATGTAQDLSLSRQAAEVVAVFDWEKCWLAGRLADAVSLSRSSHCLLRTTPSALRLRQAALPFHPGYATPTHVMWKIQKSQPTGPVADELRHVRRCVRARMAGEDAESLKSSRQGRACSSVSYWFKFWFKLCWSPTEWGFEDSEFWWSRWTGFWALQFVLFWNR